MNNLLQLFEQSQQTKSFNPNDRVLIIDGTNTWIRVVSSVAALNDNGVNVGGIIGFLRSIGSNIREFNASRCIIVFDGKGGSLRRKRIFSEYKANRTGKFKPRQVDGCQLNEQQLQESMRWQLQRTVMYLQNLPVQIVCLDNIEADDAIAYISKQYFEQGTNKMRIVSTDRDFLQLLNSRIEVYSPVKKVLYTPQKLSDEIKIAAGNYLLYRTMTGDSSDNIPGVNGLGLKTLLKSFPQLTTDILSLNDIFTICEQELLNKKPKQIYQTILNSKEQIEINYKLMQLHETDISMSSVNSIETIMNRSPDKMNKSQFINLLMEDFMTTSLSKDINNWLYSTFNILNSWATT